MTRLNVRRCRLSRILATSAMLSLAVLSVVPARAAGTCDGLAAEIADKLRGNGVATFQLEIVPAELVVGDKVVGSCDRGRKKITLVRPAAPRVRNAAPAGSGAAR